MERIDEYPIINVKMWSKRYGGSVEVDIDPRKKFTCKDLETEIKFFNDVKNIKSKYTNQVANNENKNTFVILLHHSKKSIFGYHKMSCL
jgi:hypothetical protein